MHVCNGAVCVMAHCLLLFYFFTCRAVLHAGMAVLCCTVLCCAMCLCRRSVTTFWPADVTAAEAANEARKLLEDILSRSIRPVSTHAAAQEVGALLSPEAIEALLRSAGSYRLSQLPVIE